MEDEKIKYRIGTNIANLRKRQGLTQAGLAEKLNYSDKAVSKWERGESVPDVVTLMALAQLFEVSVDDLVSDQDALPENAGPVQQAMGHMVEKAFKRKADKRIIVALSSILVWFVAVLIYVTMASLGLEKSWLAFFYAIPADAIVMLCLRSAWRDFRRNQVLISVIMWGGLLCIYMTVFVFLHVHVWRVFLLGVPGQIAILLWFRMFRSAPKVEVNNGQESAEKSDS